MADARNAQSNRKEANEITEKLMAVRSQALSHACRLLVPDPFVPAVSRVVGEQLRSGHTGMLAGCQWAH